MKEQKWGLLLLTAFVVGNMVGGGIFQLPATLAQVASPFGILASWGITGIGVFFLAIVFGRLAILKPELSNGPQDYAAALFNKPRAKHIAGYSMVWGYWAANWPSSAAVIISFSGYLSTFFPVLKSNRILFTLGNFSIIEGNFITFLVSSFLLWGIQLILQLNYKDAGKINLLPTIMKVLGFLLFMIVALSAFQSSHFTPFSYPVVGPNGVKHGILGQMNSGAISTLWAFIGIESAIMLYNRAKSGKDVERATILGLVVALVIYIGITILTIGALPMRDLVHSTSPLVDAFDRAIGGGYGSYILAFIACLALVGSVVGWVIVTTEVPFIAAQKGYMPKYFAKTTPNGCPVRSLTLTNLFTQIFLFSILSKTLNQAFMFGIEISTLAYLVPYLISSLFLLKIAYTGEIFKNEQTERNMTIFISICAFIYSCWVVITGTAQLLTFFLGIGLFLFGFVLYPFFHRSTKII
jgi:arginine:ornithine antiporter/lysine permease